MGVQYVQVFTTQYIAVNFNLHDRAGTFVSLLIIIVDLPIIISYRMTNTAVDWKDLNSL